MEKLKTDVEQLQVIYYQSILHFENMKKQMSYLDLQIEDIMHYIEFSSFNASEGYIIAKIIKNIRQKRRVIKNELELLQSIIPLFEKNQAEIEKLKNNINKRISNQTNKKYTLPKCSILISYLAIFQKIKYRIEI